MLKIIVVILGVAMAELNVDKLDDQVTTSSGEFGARSVEGIEIIEREVDSHNYISPELKRQQDFKFYNNTNVFVSIRPAYK